MSNILSWSAKQIWASGPLFLDTETTGLRTADEIVEIAIVDSEGVVLLDTFVKPTIPIPASATFIHGVSDAKVLNAPSFDIVLQKVLSIVQNRLVVIYNANFDTRVIRQSSKPYGLKAELGEVFCAMHMCAEFLGDWNASTGS